MKKVRISGNASSESTILSAFTESMNAAVDVTAIRDKYLALVTHSQQYYKALSLFARINKIIELEVFAEYAFSELAKYKWEPEYDVLYLMKNLRNKSVIADCKSALSKLIDSEWISYIIAFFETAQAWKQDMFVESEDPVERHNRILTPVEHDTAARIKIAGSLFTKPETQLLFTRNVKFSSETEIDLHHEFISIRKADWCAILFPMLHGQPVDAKINSNYISISNLMLFANNIVNDIYTPDISCDAVYDFVQQGLSRLTEGTAGRYVAAKKFITSKTELFRENFHKYYRSYVHDGSMMTFMMGYIEDINESVKTESDSNDTMENIDKMQHMILNKINSDSNFAAYRPMLSKLMEKNERDSVIRDTQKNLALIRRDNKPA